MNDSIVDSLCAEIAALPFRSSRRACADRVISKLQARSRAGQVKYGTTLDREDLTARELLEQAQKEAMDLANYLQKLIILGRVDLEPLRATAVDTAIELEIELARELQTAN
jgi:hypothetical protein